MKGIDNRTKCMEMGFYIIKTNKLHIKANFLKIAFIIKDHYTIIVQLLLKNH